MSKTIVISLIFYLIFAGKVFAEEPSAVFAKANTEYQQGRYEEAGGLYEQILESGQESGALYYNLGNSYFKKGQIGKAILNYERALDFFPRDADLQANYAFARSITRGLDERGTVFARFAKRGALLLARNEYAWVALFLLGVLAGVHLMSLSFNWRRNLQTVVIMVGLLALIFHGFFWVLHERFFARRAIVLKDSSVLFEPREGATAHFQVYEGDPVEVLKIQDSWGKVARFDGKEGWITTDHFERLRRGKTNQ